VVAAPINNKPREVSGSKPGRVLYLAGLVYLQAPYRSGDVSATKHRTP